MSDPRHPGHETGNGEGRGRRWLLIASLALNLFVIAWLVAAGLHWTGVLDHHRGGFGHHAGEWARAHGDGGRGFVRPRGLFRDFLEERPADGPARALFERHGPGLRDAFDEARDARRWLHDLLEAAEHGAQIDKAALADALAGVRAATQRVQERMHAALLDAADHLDAEALEDLVAHGGSRRRYHDGDD